MVGWLIWWIEWVTRFQKLFPYTYPNNASVLSHTFPSSFIFKFGELGGFTAIQTKLNIDEIEIAVRVTILGLIFSPSWLTYFKSNGIVATLGMVDRLWDSVCRRKVTMFTTTALSCSALNVSLSFPLPPILTYTQTHPLIPPLCVVKTLCCVVCSEASLYWCFLLGTWPEPAQCKAIDWDAHIHTRKHTRSTISISKRHRLLSSSSGSSVECVSCQIPNIPRGKGERRSESERRKDNGSAPLLYCLPGLSHSFVFFEQEVKWGRGRGGFTEWKEDEGELRSRNGWLPEKKETGTIH